MPRVSGAFRILSTAGLAALVAGAGGMGMEVVLLSGAGVALGFDRSAAWGLALWLAAWSVGAWCAGRVRWPGRRAYALLGLLSLAGAPLALALLRVAASTSSNALAIVLAVAALALTGIPQGAFLPWLARALGDRRAAIPLLFAANLAGCVVGAACFGYWLPAVAGRWLAAFGAGGASALAAALAFFVAGGAKDEARATSAIPEAENSAQGLSIPRAGTVLALATAWIAGLEWIGLRLAVLWLGGMQRALALVLVASLAALALGAALLAPLLPARRGSVALVLGLGLFGTLWPFVAPRALHALDDLADWQRAALIVGPALLPFGALLPVLHRLLAGESGRRLGDLLLYEALGAGIGLPLLHRACMPYLGVNGSLAVLAGLGLLAGLLLRSRALALALGVASVLVAVFAARASPPALEAPALDHPAFQRLFFAEDECFAVSVVDDAVRNERTLLTDDFRATASGPAYLYMHVLGHLPLLLHPAPRHVAVLALGTGTTAAAVALHPEVERIEILEISRRVCEAVPLFPASAQGGFSEALGRARTGGDERVQLHLGDGRRTLGSFDGELDVLTMEPLLPDSPYAVHLYTSEFYARARRALAPGGLLCQWVPPHALSAPAFDAVVDAFVRSFGWSGLFLYGSQLILLGGESLPALDPRRFPEPGSALYVGLAAVGLEEPAGVLGRFVTEGERWPSVARRLTDADPWILYRRRERGAAALLVLPENLSRVRHLAGHPVPEWSMVLDARGLERVRGGELLHAAQEVWARRRAELLGVPTGRADPDLPALDAARAELERRMAGDPEARAFLDEVRLEDLRLSGVIALGSGRPADAMRAFLDAIDLVGERADLHLFAAVAFEQAGEAPAARAAHRRALELCPRILETPQGQKALSLARKGGILGQPP